MLGYFLSKVNTMDRGMCWYWDTNSEKLAFVDNVSQD